MSITPDPLTSTANLKTVLGISDASEDTALALLVTEVSALIAKSLRRQVLLATNAANPLTVILSGNGRPKLVLPERPLQCPIVTGDTTAGSAVVTAVSSTSYLFANACVSGSTLTAASFITSVDSTSQITLNQAAATTATAATLVVGPAVWQDNAAYYGSVAGSFASTTQLFEGTDFFVRRDQYGQGASNAGMLEKINDVWDGQWRRDVGQLSVYQGNGQGNVKVTFWAGFDVLPTDLELAAIRTIGKARDSKWYGAMVTSEGDEGQSHSLEQHRGEIALGLLDRDVAPILARYRNFSLGGIG